MNGWWLAFGSIFTIVSGYFLKVWSVFIADIRLDNNLSYKLYRELRGSQYKKIQFDEYMDTDEDSDELPPALTYYIWHKVPFRFRIIEQEMKAGYAGTRKVATITTFRPFKNILKQFIRSHAKVIRDYYSCVYVDGFYRYACKIPGDYEIPALRDREKEKLTTLIEGLKRNSYKTGLLLYGSPGNGKTSIVRYIAAQLKCGVYIPLIQQDTTDSQLISMFTALPREMQAVILLEDFDNHFNGRQCVHPEAKLNFSTVLNVLDGLYCDLSDKLIIMTTNRIENIDPALKNRPSRFDLSMFIDNPDCSARYEILVRGGQNGHADLLTKLTHGQSGAVVSEIARHRFTENIEAEVKEIIDSFDVNDQSYNTNVSHGKSGGAIPAEVQEIFNKLGTTPKLRR